MWPNPQFPADLVTFTEETNNGKLHFLCSDKYTECLVYVQFTICVKEISFFSNHLKFENFVFRSLRFDGPCILLEQSRVSYQYDITSRK